MIEIHFKRSYTVNTRRTFIKKSVLAAATLSAPCLPSCMTIGTTKAKIPMKSGPVGRALVLWYSQTGHTQRCGRVLAKTLAQKGVMAESFDLRALQPEKIVSNVAPVLKKALSMPLILNNIRWIPLPVSCVLAASIPVSTRPSTWNTARKR